LDPFSIASQVSVKAAAVRRLRRGHLWIYAGELDREPIDIDPAIVQVLDPAGNALGYAFYSRLSQIRLRLFSRDAAPPTPDLFRERIRNSIARRRSLLDSAASCRLVFGEGDLLPGIIVDRYGDFLVLQTLSYGAEAINCIPRVFCKGTTLKHGGWKVWKKFAAFYGAMFPTKRKLLRMERASSSI
jgi:23S rRNA G2069 N7-methylase RlmK/C1962 C5-methylase RlmI